MKISIFMPIYYRKEVVIPCINSCLSTMKCKKSEVSLHIVDNKSGQELRQWIVNKTENIDNVTVDLLDRNVGKAKAINFLTRKYPNFEYFINLDSDIRFSRIGWPEVLANLFTVIEDSGMISPNYEDNGNNPMPDQPKRDTIFCGSEKFTYHWGGSVAGGCFITSKELWERMGGYTAKGTYGGVDGIARQTIANRFSKKCGFIEELEVEHMVDPPKYKKYSEWKYQVVSNLHKYGVNADPKKIGNDKGFYDGEEEN